LTTPATHWDAILFDFDGVLADTEPIHYECWKQILEPYGIQFDWPFYQKHCIGISDRLMVERFAAQRVPPLPFDEILPAYRSKVGVFRTRIMSQPPFLPETVQLVRTISLRYGLAVVSSSGRSEVEPPIELAGIRPCFQAIVCGKEAKNLKPAPDPYLRAAALIGASRPLVVEDSDAGFTSGRAAGFDVLRVSAADRVAEEIRAVLEAGPSALRDDGGLRR